MAASSSSSVGSFTPDVRPRGRNGPSPENSRAGWAAALSRRMEDERVVNLHAAAAFRFGKLDSFDHVGDAIRDVRIDAARRRLRDISVRIDEELRLDRADETRLGEQLLL